jgi:hypothetical protein
MLQARSHSAVGRAYALHPLLGDFVERYGVHRLRMLPVDDPDYGELRRRELREAWNRHREATEERDVAALASRRRGELRRFDPLRSLNPPAHLKVAKEPTA